VVGTGIQRIDGAALPGIFSRRRVTAMREVDNVPTMCPDQHQTTVELDLEGGLTGTLKFFETRLLACPPGTTTCKGEMFLQLAPAK
jgi:hypothetical protein